MDLYPNIMSEQYAIPADIFHPPINPTLATLAY